ncbi:MAG: ROK family protein [Myxococcota bacterium]
MRFGIDLGGTKVELIAFEGPKPVLRRRVPTPADAYDAIVQTVATLVHDAERALGQSGSVGIGTPGSVSPKTGRMRNCNTVVLNGEPLQADLEDALGRSIRLSNDANCFALSEAVDGAAAGADVVFGVILGTGVGGGIVVHGTVLEGANGVAGEWGHSPLPGPLDDERPGPACYCGRRGCIETFLSGPAVAAEHARRTGEQASPVELAARDDEPTWARYEDRLARSLAPVVNVLDPDVIVLGGGLSNVTRLYANVPRLLATHVFSDVLNTRLVQAQHGDSSGVRGAAWLWS